MLPSIVIILFSLFNPILTLSWTLEHHHIEYNFVNKHYFSKFTVSNTKYNRTTRTFGADFTLLREVGPLKLHVRVERLSENNEWKVLPGMTWSLNVCFIVNNNIFGVKDLIKDTNIVLECPVKKGTYYIKNIKLDETKWNMPLIALYGKYRSIISIYEDTGLMTKVIWYGAVVPIKKKH